MTAEAVHDKKPDFETVYEVFYDRIYKYAYTILLNRENAEDVVAETFFAAYIAYPGYDPARAALATWLTRIAHNKAVDFVKSAAYRKREELNGSDEPSTSEDLTGKTETTETVRWLYSHLTRAECEFLNLRYVMELKDAEIAELYGLPVKTINKRYQRLLAKCRRLLEDA